MEFEKPLNPETSVEQIVNDAIPDAEKKRRERREYMREYQRKKRAKLKEQPAKFVDVTEPEPQPETQRDQKPTATDEPELIQTIEEIKPEPSAVEHVQLTEPQKVFISGRMFLMMINFIAPEAFAMMYNLFNKKQKIKSDDLKLTDEEKNEVEPLADEVAREIMSNTSPMTQFLMYMGIIYGSKLMFAKKYPVENE